MDVNDIIDNFLSAEREENECFLYKLFYVENFYELKKEIEDIVNSKESTIIGNISNNEKYVLNEDEIVPTNEKLSTIIEGAWKSHTIFRKTLGWFENEPYPKCKDDILGKKFFHKDDYPEVAKYLNLFPNKIGSNISSLLPNTRLLPHSESALVNFEEKLSYIFRFHLTIHENITSYHWFNGNYYHLEPGYVYLFNFGAKHAAFNNSQNIRSNLIIDSLASKKMNSLLKFAKLENNIIGKEDFYFNPKNKRTTIDPTDVKSKDIYMWDDL